MTDWKKLFELKQEDWLAACKEIDELKAALEKLEEAVTFVRPYRGTENLRKAIDGAREVLKRHSGEGK